MLTQGPTNGPTTQASSLRAAALRKNGKHFHIAKAAFRPNAGQITYAKRMAQRQVYDSMKGRERALQKQKEEERQKQNEAIRARRAAKQDKERYDAMALRMHRKRLDRLKRREKRTKTLKS